MIVENFNSTNNNAKLEYLAYAQTISNFFVDALDQNDCNVKVVVGFYQELDDTIESIKDLDNAFKPSTTLPSFDDIKRPSNPIIEPDKVIDNPLTSDEITQAAIETLKEKCFRCHLEMPKINFHNDLSFLVNKLKGQLEIYKATFDNPFRGNYCHLAYSMQYTCIPDLVKMLGLCMTAYAAVLALNKLPTFSLNAFIKGIIGSLLAKIVGSISISLDATSTGLPCVLGILEELAYKLPTYENTYQQFDEDQRPHSFVRDEDYEPLSEYEKRYTQYVKDGIITQEDYESIIKDYRKSVDPINLYKETLEEKVGNVEDAVSGIFDQVNKVFASAQEDINGYISAILGVINFFECENKRSGPDFSEVMEYIQTLGTVINIFSALIAIIVPKTIFWELCKDEKSYNELKDTMQESIQEPLTKTDLEDIIEEFTEHKAQITEDGLAVHIYDKPIKTRLPKLSLMGCNFKEFAEAHTLENIIKGSISDYLEEEELKKETIYKDFETNDITLDKNSRPRKPVPNFRPTESDNTAEVENPSTGIILPLEGILKTPISLPVIDNSSYRDRVNQVVYDKFVPGAISNNTKVTKLYESYIKGYTSLTTKIEDTPNKEKVWLDTTISNIFKYQPYSKEDLFLGEQVFNKHYTPALPIYNYIQKIDHLNNMTSYKPYENGILNIETNTPSYSITQDAQDYTFGTTVDTSKIKENLNNPNRQDTIDYAITQTIDISLEDIIGSKDNFDAVLDDIMDFIYNDPNPNNQDIINKDITEISTSEKNFEDSFSIYKDLDNSTRKTTNSKECRSVEDVMSILNNIRT